MTTMQIGLHVHICDFTVCQSDSSSRYSYAINLSSLNRFERYLQEY